ncbi:MAG: response regulator, partial [Maricaulaceae bacterium]
MSLAAELAPHLPYLRRYARALTGSQASGDAYVRAALKALVDGAQALKTDAAPRIALFNLFNAIWSTTGAQLSAEPAGADTNAELRVLKVTPRPRQALLLTAVEGFSRSDAADVMDVSPAEIERLLADAQTEIESDLQTRVLIVEDEPIIAIDIENIAKSLGHVVTSIARTHTEAVAAAKADPPGLVLADIRLADGSSGVEAANEVLADYDAPVVFVSAFAERLLPGDRPAAPDLIPKPVLSHAQNAPL